MQFIKKTFGVGIVCAVGAGKVFVAPVPEADDAGQSAPARSSNKNGCGSRSGCGKCGGCLSDATTHGGYVGRFYISVNNANDFKPGDRLAYSRYLLEPNLASMLVFGVPIALAVSVILYVMKTAPQSVESAKTLFVTIAAFFGGFAAVGLFDRIFKAKYPAVIVERYGNDFVDRNDNGNGYDDMAGADGDGGLPMAAPASKPSAMSVRSMTTIKAGA